MLTKEDLQAISQLIKNEVEPINKRLDKVDTRLDSMDTRLDNIENDIAIMKDDIEIIKEDCEITRVTTNELVKWVDFNFGEERPFPVRDEIDEEIISPLMDKINEKS